MDKQQLINDGYAVKIIIQKEISIVELQLSSPAFQSIRKNLQYNLDKLMQELQFVNDTLQYLND